MQELETARRALDRMIAEVRLLEQENAELWKVASAAIDWRNCYGEKYDAALLQSVVAFNAWRKANDVPRRE